MRYTVSTHTVQCIQTDRGVNIDIDIYINIYLKELYTIWPNVCGRLTFTPKLEAYKCIECLRMYASVHNTESLVHAETSENAHVNNRVTTRKDASSRQAFISKQSEGRTK